MKNLIILILGIFFLTSCSSNKVTSTSMGFNITKHQKKNLRSFGGRQVVTHRHPYKKNYKFNKKYSSMKKEGRDSFFNSRK